MELLEVVEFNAQGLVPAIVQDVKNGQVLMMAWMSRESLQKTMDKGETYFWSRSRQCLWHKGGSSGHVQRVRELWVDCDGDTLLVKVEQTGGACHVGYRSCFYRRADAAGTLSIQGEKVFEPDQVYG